MNKRFLVMLVLSLLVIGLLSSCVRPVEDTNTNEPVEIVVNGDFSERILGDDENVGFEGWFKFTPEGADWNGWASSSATIVNGEAKVVVNNPGSGTWTIQLAQWLNNIEGGKTYTIKFKAKSTAENPALNFVVTARKNDDNNLWIDPPFLAESVSLTSDWKDYSYEVEIPSDFDLDSYTVKLGFELGTSPIGEYYFDDVSVMEK
ncbi:carbohydrate binding domain-containing protein [Marinitoga sp. 38H-ov]|uniref:carbohydrate binding domain-containing protein n=1 Tax=Marinitoga sp. 38H-ov TaxID=1755814 RepID=UPI0013EA3B61|nr:carbohydrate binding domain-containing protein [Marinitoga sp. 38H-ov]KAF2956523.1 hypothetical protein AS160_05705 [Marinitoga sp. 38H-ov]